MSRLYLVRHAKAGWAMPGVRDFDRALDASGVTDAEALGVAMRAGHHIPDLTICSNARRARETLEGLAAHADTGRVVFTDVLYSGDANTYLTTIRENGAHGSLLIIGHNPMMEDLALAISGGGEEDARAALGYGFPTSGLAIIRFEGSLAEARLAGGYLEAFLTPADM